MEGCTERTEIFGMVWKPVPSVPKRSVGYIPAEIPAVYLGTYRTEHTLAIFQYYWLTRCKNGKLASRLQIVGENRGEMGRSLATTDRQDGKATVVGGIANLAR